MLCHFCFSSLLRSSTKSAPRREKEESEERGSNFNCVDSCCYHPWHRFCNGKPSLDILGLFHCILYDCFELTRFFLPAGNKVNGILINKTIF